MKVLRFGLASIFAVTMSAGCGAPDESDLAIDSISTAVDDSYCSKVEPKDHLIAQLFKTAADEGYPLTKLAEGPGETVTGSNMPNAVAGVVELINSVPEARTACVAAIRKIGVLPDYVLGAVTKVDDGGCTDVPAWTPSGDTMISTEEYELTVTVNETSWRAVVREYGKECDLIKGGQGKLAFDPAGDGSTNLPPSNTVSATGVTANSFGICPSGSTAGTYCKLYSATGVRWTGRKCTSYSGSLRCLLY